MAGRQVGNSMWLPLWCISVIGLGVIPGSTVSAVDPLSPLGNPMFGADLENPAHVAVSLDRKNVYVTSDWRGGALITFKRDVTTGALEHYDVIRDGQSGVDGLSRPNGIVISKNNKFVYVASGGDNAVSVFTRNTVTGKLTFLEVQKGGLTWNGLTACFAVALSPDQRHLYASGIGDNTLAVFSVNSSNGRLTFVEVYRNNEGGLLNFRTPRSIAVASPDGSLVLVSAESSNTLFIFNRNQSNGRLTLAKAWPNNTEGLSGLISPWQIVFSDNGLNAYIACSGFGLVALGRSSASKPLGVLEEHPNRFPDHYLGGLKYLALSPVPDQTRLYASAETDGSLTVFARNPLTGGLAKRAQIRQSAGGLQPFTLPRQVAVSSDGANVYVAAGEGALHCFKLLGLGGEISWDSVLFGSPDQLFRGIGSGARVCLSPDGLSVYLSATGVNNLITCLKRNKTTGVLTWVQTIGAYGDWYLFDWLWDVKQIIVSPNRHDVYLCAAGSDAIVHFYRDLTDGHLIFQEAYYNGSGITGMNDPWAMVLSSDGKYLFVAARGSDSILVFQMLPDGSLVFQKSFANGAGTANRLDAPSNLCLSPDGKFLYVTAEQGNAVLVFSWTAAGAVLTYQGFVADGVGGVTGLSRPLGIAMAPPDGKYVYVCVWGASSIACFSRDANTGLLTFIGAVPAFWNSGLNMTFDPTGKYLFVPFEGSHIVAVFERNAQTGLLTLLYSLSGVPLQGLDGLAGPQSIAIADNHLYVGCPLDDALRILKFTK